MNQSILQSTPAMMTEPPSEVIATQPAYDTEEAQNQLRTQLDAQSDLAALLNAQGVIVLVNRAWRHYSLARCPLPGQLTPHSDVGVNYLEVASRDNEPHDGSGQAVDGIRSVLSGRAEAFTLRYPCHTPQQQFWFTMKVTPLQWQGQPAVLVTHTDSTPRHRLQSG